MVVVVVVVVEIVDDVEDVEDVDDTTGEVEGPVTGASPVSAQHLTLNFVSAFAALHIGSRPPVVLPPITQ